MPLAGKTVRNEAYRAVQSIEESKREVTPQYAPHQTEMSETVPAIYDIIIGRPCWSPDLTENDRLRSIDFMISKASFTNSR